MQLYECIIYIIKHIQYKILKMRWEREKKEKINKLSYFPHSQ